MMRVSCAAMGLDKSNKKRANGKWAFMRGVLAPQAYEMLGTNGTNPMLEYWGQRNTYTPAGSGTGCAEARIIDRNLAIEEACPVKSGVRWCREVGVMSNKSWW